MNSQEREMVSRRCGNLQPDGTPHPLDPLSERFGGRLEDGDVYGTGVSVTGTSVVEVNGPEEEPEVPASEPVIVKEAREEAPATPSKFQVPRRVLPVPRLDRPTKESKEVIPETPAHAVVPAPQPTVTHPAAAETTDLQRWLSRLDHRKISFRMMLPGLGEFRLKVQHVQVSEKSLIAFIHPDDLAFRPDHGMTSEVVIKAPGVDLKEKIMFLQIVEDPEEFPFAVITAIRDTQKHGEER